jgi:protocatechuate 3,4-dioxygenase beta subunit
MDMSTTYAKIIGKASDYGWGSTEDGKGIVVWKGDWYEILGAGVSITFDDATVDTAVYGTNWLFTDSIAKTEVATGTGAAASASVSATLAGKASDYGWGATEDGKGIVVWKGDWYKILKADATIAFDDATVDTAIHGTSGVYAGAAATGTTAATPVTTTPEAADAATKLAGKASDYGWGPTEDGQGMVVWKGAWYQIFDAGSTVAFDNGKVTISADRVITAEIEKTGWKPGDPRPAEWMDAVEDAFTAEKNDSITGNLLTNDRNFDPATVQLSITQQPANGTVTVNADGTFTYVPKPGFIGEDSFTYKIKDDCGCNDSAVVKVTYCPPEEPAATASIGDYVWLDTDGDGLQDAAEQAVPGVTVRLLDGDGNVVATQETDASGKYLFDKLKPGQYQVEFVTPDGYTFTSANGGADDLDSDADASTGRSPVIDLKEGEHIRTVDAGLCPPAPPPVVPAATASIGDYVWLDTDGDGLQDAAEQAVSGVTVRLLDGDGNVVATQETDASGKYLFDKLKPGQYQVEFVTPEGYTFTSANGGADDLDSDADASTGRSPVIDLKEGENIRTVDAGLCPPAPPPEPEPLLSSIGDYVWLDGDRDGLQDDGETAVPGVTVNLLDATGAVVATQQTDATGRYLFDKLQPGDYRVEFVAPDGYEFTAKDAGIASVDSDADRTTGRTDVINLDENEHIRTVDAGIVIKAAAVPDAVKVCEDKAIDFNVLANDSGDGLKLIGVSHETADLQSEFSARGGKLSFTADGTVSYQGMTNYYGFDKLVYTMQNSAGETFTETVNIELTPASDAPIGAGGRSYHPGEWQDAYSTVAGARATVLKPEDFGSATVSDGNDALQQFSDYNKDVVSDKDTAKSIVFTGVKDANAWLVHKGVQLDFSNGQTHEVPIEDIFSGLVQLEHAPPYYQAHEFTWQLKDTGNAGGKCGSENITKVYESTISTPIALDLNGDGKIGVTGETTSYQKDAGAELGRTVSFDIDADGNVDTIEWFAGDGDGILVDMSKIGADGEIDGKALFGDEGGKYANGYEKLALLDSEGDGVLADAELEMLGVWIDDGDAKLEEGELQSAADAGIASISTAVETVLDDQGRELMQSSAFSVDGTEILTEDVWFACSDYPAPLPLENEDTNLAA